ncbi:MAG: hypothetical protein AAFO96_03615 [Bacteroidota bacterium]
MNTRQQTKTMQQFRTMLVWIILPHAGREITDSILDLWWENLAKKNAQAFTDLAKIWLEVASDLGDLNPKPLNTWLKSMNKEDVKVLQKSLPETHEERLAWVKLLQMALSWCAPDAELPRIKQAIQNAYLGTYLIPANF